MSDQKGFPFSLANILLGQRRFENLDVQARSHILLYAILLTLPMPLVDGILSFLFTDAFPLCSIAALILLPTCVIGLRLGWEVRTAGTLYGFAMQLSFLESMSLHDSRVSLVGVFFVLLLSIFIVGRRRAAFFLILPAAFFLGFRRYLSGLQIPGWNDLTSVEGYSLSETISLLCALALAYVTGYALEGLSLRLYRAYTRESERVRREISIRVEKEAELAESLHLFESVFNAIPVPVFTKGVDLRYQRCSAAFYDFFGLDRSSVEGRSLEDLLPSGEASTFQEADRIVLETGRTIYLPSRMTPAGGRTRDVFALKTPNRSSDGTTIGLIGVILDQTELRAREQKLNTLLENSRGALALLGHDLRNPIGSFRDLVRSIRADLSIDPDEYRTVLLEMEKSLDSLWRLLDELLDWARTEGEFSAFDPEFSPLSPLVEEVMRTVDAQAKGKGVGISLAIPGDLAAFADPRMLSTILRNLVSNSIKFTPRGGSVSVGAEAFDFPGLGEGVRLFVSDTGIGMSSAVIRSMMDAGVAVHRRGTEGEPGTGLGLSLCRRLVDRHGGTLEIESVEGRGSTFAVFLPFRKTAEPGMI